MIRAGALVASLFALAAAAIGLTALEGCLTAPPPDLPVHAPVPPTILHESVVPPADAVLTRWPSQFIVPVELSDPTETFYYDVFIDYNPDPTAQSAPAIFPRPVDPSLADGGITIVEVTLDAPDPNFCHRIEILVAHQFNATSPHTPDSIGGDGVAWLYNAGGGPSGCPAYDAGAFQDGAFPSSDAPVDALPVTPESGPGP